MGLTSTVIFDIKKETGLKKNIVRAYMTSLVTIQLGGTAVLCAGAMMTLWG